MIRLYRFPLSTNVERVALALAYKKLPVESVVIDPADRSELRRVSGQDLVPVLEEDGRVVFDSMQIVRYLEERYPEPALYPRDAARRAEMLIFIDWFNRVWKRPPNAMEAEMGKAEPDRGQIAAWGREMTEALDLFEGLLTGREFLMGDRFSAADAAAFPFLKYAWHGHERMRVDNDSYLFHKILVDNMPLGEDHPRLTDWIGRVDRFPRA
jgi:glutathione S-transferase